MRAKLANVSRDREHRVSVSFDATLIEPDGCVVPVTVLDVSGSGFRISSHSELVVGEEVRLHLPPSEPVRANICWTRGSEAGGIFLEAPPIL